MVAALKESGVTELVVASTGNVAISYSAYRCKSWDQMLGIPHQRGSSGKMREVAIYGTQVIKVTGSYDQTKQVAATFAKQRGLSRIPAHDPFRQLKE